jgi:lipoprotein-anchoring transpeptidase ErfK/SrfK
MNNQFIEAREFIAKAREALRRGDRQSARRLGEQAALRAPKMEDVWLILAASDPDPQEALAYARKALQINPQSRRARQAVEWVSDQLKQARASNARRPVPPRIMPNQVDAVTSLPQKRAYQTAIALPQLTADRPNWLLPALLTGAGFMLVGFIVLFALTSPAVASLVRRISAPPEKILWAPVEIAHPKETPMDGNAFAPPPAQDPSRLDPLATDEPTSTDIPTEAPTATPAAAETPGTMAMEIVADTPTSAYVAPMYAPPKEQIASSGNGERWIDVDLTNQRLYAYEGDTIVNSFIVSTGTWIHPTVTGKYKIYIKLRSGSMSGPGYFLPNVPYIMYFYKSYGLHGTYWHNNFGTPMSHGCINLRTDEAAWLYDWASMGTVVNVHY